MVKLPDNLIFPFRGRVVWLTADQGGRRSGPPRTDGQHYYAANAFVPPHTAESGLASFVLRNVEGSTLVSTAEGRWLTVENTGTHLIQMGTVVVITEGPKPVGYFHIEAVWNT